MSKQIVGLVGLIGSGKDSSAEMLVTKHGFIRESFAASLKDAVASIFVWDREMLEGKTKEAREKREEVDEWWSDRLGRKLSPRLVLQLVGTEVFRNNFHPDIWLASFERRIMSSDSNIVVSDCRFPNEVELIKKYGKVYRIKRGPEPAWWEEAQRHAALMERYSNLKAELQNFPDVHYSEWSWSNIQMDGIIENNGSFTDLMDKIDGLVRD